MSSVLPYAGGPVGARGRGRGRGRGGRAARGDGGRGRGRGRGGPAWPAVDVFDEEDRLVGQVKYGAAENVLTANCWFRSEGHAGPDHGLCRINKTCNAHAHREGQGRPLGFLVAWLWRASDPLCVDRACHYDARHDISLEDRIAARGWLSARPEFAFFLEQERVLYPGEELEPENFHIV